MNKLQHFMGCMYPGIIRTESIESMDYDYPERCFEASNIEEHGHIVSSGQMQLTDNHLIYFRPGKPPIRWPIDYIRRFGCSHDGTIFGFEAGRRSPTGEAIYAFHVTRANELVDRLKETIEKLANRKAEPQTQSATCSLIDDSRHYKHQQQYSSQDTNWPRASNSDAIQERNQPNAPSGSSQPNKVAVDLKPLSYSGINHDMTKSLHELALAHAAFRKT